MEWNPSDWFWSTFIGLVGGAILSALTGWIFAWKGSKDLAKTHGQLIILLRALEGEGAIHLNRNQTGDAIGVVIKLSGSSVGTSHASAEGLIVQRKEPTSDGNSNAGI